MSRGQEHTHFSQCWGRTEHHFEYKGINVYSVLPLLNCHLSSFVRLKNDTWFSVKRRPVTCCVYRLDQCQRLDLSQLDKSEHCKHCGFACLCFWLNFTESRRPRALTWHAIDFNERERENITPLKVTVDLNKTPVCVCVSQTVFFSSSLTLPFL